MVPGGMTEMIGYFAGYLRLEADFVRARLDYDGAWLRSLQQDDPARPQHDPGKADDADDLGAARIPPPRLELADDIAGPHPAKLHLKIFQPHEGDDDGPLGLPRFGVSMPGGIAASMGTDLQISVSYEPGGDQKFVQIEQLNVMNDNDLFGVSSDSGVHGTLATLVSMVDQAHAVTPADLVIPDDTHAGNGPGSLPEFIAARDASIAAHEIDDSQYAVSPGVYVNGELQSDGATPPAVTDPVTVGPTEGYGQWADMGGNHATNTAQIIDASAASRAMIVLGDVYKTDAIIQVNVLVDSDDVDIAGPVGLTPALAPDHIVPGNNQLDNTAEFTQNESVFGISAHFAGMRWHVDVVDGNFYNVTYVQQTNILSDNDIVSQNTQESHFSVHTGANELLNWMQGIDWGNQYDVIIVAGNFHGANFIYQTNVVLDTDVVKISAEGDGSADGAAPQYASTGQNLLQNDGSIINYGGNVFLPLSSGMEELAKLIGQNDPTLDVTNGLLLPGNGTGALNVLYVSGDYYDVNVIAQTNVISDVDTALQFYSGQPVGQGVTQEGGVGGGGSSGSSGYAQVVSTGSNEATNAAQIIDVGSTVTYLGGQPYQDSMLIQAEIVTDNDHVVYNNTETLVPELVAFLSAPGDHQDDSVPLPTIGPILQDDHVSHIMT